MDCHSSARISSKSAIVQNKQLQGPRSSGPCKSKMNSLLDAGWPARGVGETRPPNGRPAALARRSVQDSGSRSTQRESTATTHIERRADSPEGCRAARSDSFRGPSPLKPRFISHSQSQRTTNEITPCTVLQHSRRRNFSSTVRTDTILLFTLET